MERNREKAPPIERGDELMAEAEQLLAAQSTSAVRCPYCHAALMEGVLAGACEKCNTLHHVSCFAEHRGCSTHGCDSARAVSLRVGEAAPVDLPRLRCALCAQTIDADAMVARCACGRHLDVSCYEEIGGCGKVRCDRPVRLLRHTEALAQRRRNGAWMYGVLGALSCAGVGLWAAAEAWGPSGLNLQEVILLGCLAVVPTLLLLVSFNALLDARRIARTPTQPVRPAKLKKAGPSAEETA